MMLRAFLFQKYSDILFLIEGKNAKEKILRIGNFFLAQKTKQPRHLKLR